MIRVTLFLLFSLLNANLFAEHGDLHRQAFVRIADTKTGVQGSGVVYCIDGPAENSDGFLGRVLTCAHLGSNSSYDVVFFNGRRSTNCTMLSFDDNEDVAHLKAWIPPGVKPVALAKQPTGRGEALTALGLNGREIAFSSSPATNNRLIYADATLIPGDSGGPVFNKDGECTGVISGGWVWYTRKDDSVATWPLRSANSHPVLKLVGQP